MSVFMIAVFFGLLLHQIVVLIQPRVGDQHIRLGRNIKIELPEKTYLTVKVILLVAVILLFLGISILAVTQDIHPGPGYAYSFADALKSPRMGAVLFGVLVGLLLGNLLHRLLKNPRDYEFKASDYLEIVLIVLLVVLGIGGEEVLRSTANRINKVSVGATTEISFSDIAPKQSRASAEQPKGAFRNTQGESGGSAGLQKLFDIGSREKPNTSRDKQFIAVLARFEDEAVRTTLDTGPLPSAVLSPIAACLSGISKIYGDATFIEQQLEAMSEPLRKMALREIPDTGPERATSLQSIQDSLSKILQRTAEYAPAKLKRREGLDERYSCADVADAGANGRAVDRTSIETFFASNETLPYATIAYASVMAALHHYESAAVTMDGWINAAEVRLSKAGNAERWYLLRARLAQTLFLDEWIRQRGTAASSWLRKYHIDNLKQIADRMRAYKAISTMSQKNADYTWNVIGALGVLHSGDEGPCAIPALPKTKTLSEEQATADDEERLKTLYSTYLSTRKDWVDHSLKHPITKMKAASIIESEIKNLMTLNLKCISTDRELTRAEHIERYVRGELNLLQNASSLKSTDEIRNRVRDAQHLLGFAFQLIEPEATAIKNGKDKGPIQNRISVEPVLEVEETLFATQDQLKSFSEREINQ